MNRFLSQKFRFYSFVCIALLLFVHGYNLDNGYLVPFSLVNEQLTLTTFFEYLLANGLLRFRIPMLFIMSGYIFALQDYKPYKLRVKNRFVTLIIPFLIWSAVGLAVTYLFQQNPVTGKAVIDSKLDQLGDNRPYSEIGWLGIFQRWLLSPVSFQLWFIRTLFVYNLCYPFFKWVIRKFPVPWFVLLLFLWGSLTHFIFFEGQGLFFFSVGIWLNKSNYRIDQKPQWFSHYLAWLFFIGLCIIKTFLAFELEADSIASVWSMSVLYVVSVLAGILAIWYSGDAVVKWCMHRRWFLWATAFSFIIYALHMPLLAYCMRLAFMYGHNIPQFRLITYILVPVVILFFCIGVGAALRRLAPKLYRVVTGGRGF